MLSVRRPMEVVVLNCCVTDTNDALCASKMSTILAKSAIGMGAGPRASVLARPLRDPGHGEAVTQIPGDARQLARAIGGARGEAGEGTVHVDPRLGRWARRCRTCAKHRASRQASTVDLSIEIGAGQGAAQGSDRILGAALFHAGLALGLSRRYEAGRRLRCENSISMRAGDGELAIGVGLRLTSTVKSKPPTRPSSRQSLTTVSKTCR